MEIHHGYAPWKNGGPDDLTKVYFGHADYDVARRQGKSDQEILNWINSNFDKFSPGPRNQPGGGGLYDMIAERARRSRSSSGGYSRDSINGGRGEKETRRNESWIKRSEGGSSGESRNDSNNSKSYIVDQTANVDNSVYTEIGNDNTFGANSSIGNNQAKTDINQTVADFLGRRSFGSADVEQNATVNNRTETKVGDRNTFGDGLRLGNNYAITDINQNGGGKRYAGDRMEDWLEVEGI